MTVVRPNLTGRPDRHKELQGNGVEVLTWYWVVGEVGATSTWFSDTKHVIGYDVCSGIAYHGRKHWGSAELTEQCSILGVPCWGDTWSPPSGDQVPSKWFATGDEDAIYQWLETHYQRLKQE